MAQGSNYKVAFRRRREGKTDYGARINMAIVKRCIRCRQPLRPDRTCQNPNCVRYVPEENTKQAEAKAKKK